MEMAIDASVESLSPCQYNECVISKNVSIKLETYLFCAKDNTKLSLGYDVIAMNIVHYP